MAVTTSAVVSSMNDDHELSAPMFVYDGSFAPSVADLTAATLSEKELIERLDVNCRTDG
jgi:hypothetical protein